ncbi:tripartite tricarboxylate transporter TctB family protein [Phascolarctobacterium sp.]|uniref:tripartite tricarboxylate transporter TctB family protein n=1 Tax=Phascolarctobacterium sp. TaxID=2049039 RepID=UPI00386FFCDD
MMNNMTICNYIVSLAGLVIGALIMQAAAVFPMEFTENGPGPGFWPFSLGFAMTVCAAVLLLYTFSKRCDLSAQKVNLATAANKRVYLMMGLVVLFCILINLLGFFPAAALLIPAVMVLMDYHNKKGIALTTILTLLFIYLVFGMLLRTQLPQSIFLS